MSLCPCRVTDAKNPVEFANCCEPYLTKKKKAPTAEALMRSRYTAYVHKNIDYIDETQITLPHENFDKAEALKWADSSEWMGLDILKTQKGEANDNTGIVDFVAHYKDKASGTELHHHETSLFNREGGDWKFKEGHVHGAQPIKRLEPKVGRNDPCPCGSGKKHKKCCAA